MISPHCVGLVRGRRALGKFRSLHQVMLKQGYEVRIVETENIEKSWPRVTVFPVTTQWNGDCEEIARRHLARGGCLVLVGSKAADIALKMPPSIGTPVQKWVRDLSDKGHHRIGEVLYGLGELPVRRVSAN